MPLVLRVKGYRFFFFSSEGQEPPHIHVEQAERYAKFWLRPVSLARLGAFEPAKSPRSSVSSRSTVRSSRRDGMSTLNVNVEPLAVDATCTDEALRVVLADGREITVPLAWFPRLQRATPEQRKGGG